MSYSIEESTITQIIYDNLKNDSLTLSGNELILNVNQETKDELEIKMNLFFKELFEPNYRKRETSLQRIVRMTSLETS